MRLRHLIVIGIVGLLAFPAAGTARGTSVTFDGGTAKERAQVTNALAASSFDFSVLPPGIVVHIARGVDSEATPGEIWLDSDLLDAGRFSWGVIQHEYAHQVDFLLFDDGDRQELATALHARVWCWIDQPGLPHASYGCERFASTLAWAYWSSSDNCMRPLSTADESAAMRPAKFRALVTRLLHR